MAKVSRLLLNEKKDKMTDEEFFTSRVMKAHFEDIIEGICKTFRRRIQIRITNWGDSVACTDGTTITVNLANDWIKNQDSRINKYYIIVGIILHECGHILYTDLALLKECLIALSDDRLVPSIEYSDGLRECFENKMGKKFLGIYKSLDNCIEDGHIEKRVLKYVPGYGECLTLVRKLHMDELGHYSYEKCLEESVTSGKKLNRVAAMLDLILMYAKYGIDNTGEVKDDLTDTFCKMRKNIDLAVLTNGAMERKKQINIVFDMLIDFISDEIEKNNKASSSSGDGSEDKDDSSSEYGSGSLDENDTSKDHSKDTDKGESSESEDKSKEIDSEPEDKAEDEDSDNEKGTYDESKGSDIGTESEKSRESEETKGGDEAADGGSSGNSEGGSESTMTSEVLESGSGMATGETMDFPYDILGEDDGLSKEEMDEAFDDILGDISDLCDEMSDKTEHEDSGLRPVPDSDRGAFETPEEGFDFVPENEDGPEDWDLSYLEDEAACEEIAKDVRNRIERAMKKNADDMRRTRIDKYPSVQKYINPDYEAIALFTSEHEELDRIARRVVKNLDKVIRERERGDRLNGLYTGKQLDSAHAYRKDKKIFSNRILPEDIPDLEVCVLVDCSGSMSYGDRMEQSRKCAYITWKFCKIMQIPCSVYGHTTTGRPEKVLMTCVAHPESMDKEDEKRIFMLRPEANNRDGWAVNFCCEALSKSHARSRMLLIISDGLPCANGYYGILGKRDCQEVVKTYKKKGISVVTAGIDDCAADIRELYIDGVSPKDAARFLDYSDMTQLPKAFANLIKKELL